MTSKYAELTADTEVSFLSRPASAAADTHPKRA
jgi:hypothetical protein